MTTTSTMIVVYDPELAGPEHVALAGFLGGYRGFTRDAYALDLRQFVAFCDERHLGLFEVRRSDIEAYGRELEARGRAMATVGRRLCTVTGFYRYAEEEGLIAHSPAVHVRRPRIDYESHAIGLDRNEVGALLVAAGLGAAAEHALVSLLALNGLRVSEAIGADIEALGLERGHRTLTIFRKGGKTVTIPLAPRTARAVDLAIGERDSGPIFITADGRRLDRHGASRIVRRVARRAEITKAIGPHTLRHAFITAALDAGVPLRDVQEAASHADPRTTMRYDRARVSLDRQPPISCPPTSPVLLADDPDILDAGRYLMDPRGGEAATTIGRRCASPRRNRATRQNDGRRHLAPCAELHLRVRMDAIGSASRTMEVRSPVSVRSRFPEPSFWRSPDRGP